MPKSVTRLSLAEQYDKQAQEHVKKAIDWEESAINATSPLERVKYSEKGRKEREAAITSLKEANIALGPDIDLDPHY